MSRPRRIEEFILQRQISKIPFYITFKTRQRTNTNIIAGRAIPLGIGDGFPSKILVKVRTSAQSVENQFGNTKELNSCSEAVRPKHLKRRKLFGSKGFLEPNYHRQQIVQKFSP